MRSTMRIGSHPIHPMLIPFPFALWTTSVLADLYAAVRDQFHYIGYWLAVAGCAGAVLAAIPGLVDYFTIIPQGTRAKRTGSGTEPSTSWRSRSSSSASPRAPTRPS